MMILGTVFIKSVWIAFHKEILNYNNEDWYDGSDFTTSKHINAQLLSPIMFYYVGSGQFIKKTQKKIK